MKKCWASVIGRCSSKISNEHYVSQAFYTESPIYQQGLIKAFGMPWDEKNLLTLPYKSFQSKLLCQKHNRELSLLDAEIGKLSTHLTSISELLNKVSDDLVHKFEVNGFLIERWFLKTFVNYHSLHFPSQDPPRELVEIIYGVRKFPKNVGLVMFGTQGRQPLKLDQDIKLVEILNNENKTEMVMFEMYGFGFMLPLTINPVPQRMTVTSDLEYDPVQELIKKFKQRKSLFHPKKITFNLGNKAKSELIFSWN